MRFAAPECVMSFGLFSEANRVFLRPQTGKPLELKISCDFFQ
jgi:hypothetical protein